MTDCTGMIPGMSLFVFNDESNMLYYKLKDELHEPTQRIAICLNTGLAFADYSFSGKKGIVLLKASVNDLVCVNMDEKSIKWGDLEEGKFFYYDDQLYLKLTEGLGPFEHKFYSLRISDGEICFRNSFMNPRELYEVAVIPVQIDLLTVMQRR